LFGQGWSASNTGLAACGWYAARFAYLGPSTHSGTPRDCNRDGTAITGVARGGLGNTYPSSAVLWDDRGLERPLAPFADFRQTEANGINDNASLIVGSGFDSPLGAPARALAWTAVSSCQLLSDFLAAEGADLADWTLTNAMDMSPDGRFIVGTGTYRGVYAAFLVRRQASVCNNDFDHDGMYGTNADIVAFFECLGGACCAECGTADFNGDGEAGTDADIESFFRVLNGFPC